MNLRVTAIAGLLLGVCMTSPFVASAQPVLTDDDWASASPATVPSLLLGHGVRRQASLIPCTNGYFYVYGDNLTAIGNLVTPTGGAKWDGRQWLPATEGELNPSQTWPIPFTVGEDHYEIHLTEDSGVSTYKLIKRGDPDIQIGNDFNGDISSLIEYKGDLYAGGSFTSVGETMVNRVARWDGTHWSSPGSGVEGEGLVMAMAVRGDDLYVGGQFQTAGGLMVNGIAKWDGTDWSTVGAVVNSFVRVMIVHDGDLLAAGWIETAGGRLDGILKWDGETWSSLGTVKSIHRIKPQWIDSTIVGADGNLYVAGHFFEIGGVSANCVARWDGTAWSTVGDSGLGINGPIHTLKSVGQDLYASGQFPGADGQIANGLAKWDGTSWSVFGSGLPISFYNLPGTIRDIAVSGSNVFVTGYFDTAGGEVAMNIARWNGFSWEPLGLGLGVEPGWTGGFGSHLAFVGTDLYVTGFFYNAGGVAATNIAKWDGTSWSSIDSPFQAAGPLAVSGSTLYAGYIGSSEGLPWGVGKWDGANWTMIGRMIDGHITSMTVKDTNLYVAGKFHSIGGIWATNVARWDGASWAPLGPGIGGDSPTHRISAIATHGSDLYAAVQFWRGVSNEEPPPSQLYKWDGISWTEVGSTTDRAIYALATLGDELYVGGAFSIAGGKASGNLARVFLNGAPPLEKSGSRATAFFRGMPAGGYHVDRTTDFITWENLATRYAGETGGIDFTDEAAPEARAFYRAVPMEP